MTVKEPGFCFGLWVLGATVGLPFTTTISQKKKIVGRIPRRGFYLLILVCFFVGWMIEVCSSFGYFEKVVQTIDSP